VLSSFMKFLTCTLLALCLVSLTGCGGPTEEKEFVQPPVGVLDTGEFLVTLHSSPEGPRYTLENKEGNLVARELSRSDFIAQFPELKEEISGLWAGNERGPFEKTELNTPVFEDLLELPATD